MTIVKWLLREDCDDESVCRPQTGTYTHFRINDATEQSCDRRDEISCTLRDRASPTQYKEETRARMATTRLATLGAGCFWCVEAVYGRLDGVLRCAPGYAGGNTVNPTYKQVCEGTTNHAEVCQITYDPAKVTFAELLEVFWRTHDPTTLNRQGNDVGTQYRSVIYYHDDDQKEIAIKSKEAAAESGLFENPIVTEISPLDTFYEAEEYHHNYFNRVGGQNSYCTFVIGPKVQKFKKLFAAKLRPDGDSSLPSAY